MNFRALVLVLAALWSWGTAEVPVYKGLPLYGRVSPLIGTYTEAEILREFGPIRPGGGGTGGLIRSAVTKGGNVIKYGGVLTITGAVVLGSLNWFYNEAKRSTGTTLDDFMNQDKEGGIEAWKWAVPSQNPYRYDKISSSLWVCYIRIVTFDGQSFEQAFYGSQTEQICNTVNDRAGQLIRNPPFAKEDGFEVLIGQWELTTSAGNKGNYEIAYVKPKRRDELPLSNFIPDQGSQDALKNIIREYLDTHPVPNILSPPPNKNQENDDVVDCTIDTDADGFTDCEELGRGPGYAPKPGNRPHPSDTGSDPNDSTSRPLDTDRDGIPDSIDSDDDNDGVPDDHETPEEQKDPEPKPCPPGYEKGLGGGCEPIKDPPKCPEGTKPDESDPPVCVPDDKPDDPVSDDCGDFSFKRLMTHTGHYIRDVVFPCDSLQDLFGPLLAAARTKYPFSLVSAINGNLIQAPESGNQSAVLPATWGPFTFDWSWLSPLLLVVGLLFKGFASWLAVDLVLSRMWGQVVIK